MEKKRNILNEQKRKIFTSEPLWKSTENVLLSCSGTNQLVCNADFIKTNVYSATLIPGRTSYFTN